ncbi:MAG: right-handed parallel beta-helix repeat-containing protein [Planctomycetota bacterium]
MEVDRLPELRWEAPGSAVSYRVFLGAGALPKEPLALTSQRSWEPELPLDSRAEYLWRVDWLAEDGTVVEGETWSFRTAVQILVPGDWPTIGGALKAASDGGTILVRPGIYREAIDFEGRSVTLRSLEGPEATILEGDGSGPVVMFQTGEGPNARLEGFTIRGGESESGGGILCRDASPTIRGNVVTANRAREGGGLYCERSSAKIEGNRIEANVADAAGGGLFASECRLQIAGNDIIGNEVEGPGEILVTGGGAALFRSEDRLEDNRIEANTVSATDAEGGSGLTALGAGLYLQGNLEAKPARLIGNRIRGNEAVAEGRAIVTAAGGGVWCLNTVLDANRIEDNAVRASSTPVLEEDEEQPFAGAGGLYLGAGSRSTNDIIVRNTVHLGATEPSAPLAGARGAGVLVEEALLVHGTIAFNEIETTLEGVRRGTGLFGREAIVINTILWQNGAAAKELEGEALDVKYCLTTEPFPGEGNKSGDPELRSDTNYHLKQTSPALDAATSLVPGGPPKRDFDGDRRPQDGNRDGQEAPDIGADERTE